jgi:hypothetical protein
VNPLLLAVVPVVPVFRFVAIAIFAAVLRSVARCWYVLVAGNTGLVLGCRAVHLDGPIGVGGGDGCRLVHSCGLQCHKSVAVERISSSCC